MTAKSLVFLIRPGNVQWYIVIVAFTVAVLLMYGCPQAFPVCVWYRQDGTMLQYK